MERHGQYKTTEYRAWASMVSRCCNPNHGSYPDYGARGITVCDRWKGSFISFLADMGRKPSTDLQLERLDNNGPYAPSNCVWATRKEQARNRRNSRIYEVDGKVATIAEWSEISGLSYQVINQRLKRGWPPSDAVKAPLVSLREAGIRGQKRRLAA